MTHPFPYSIKRHGTTLEQCEHEPVQTPGCAQAHGVVLVLRPVDLTIVQVSENSAAWLGRTPDELLSTLLSAHLGDDASAKVLQALREDAPERVPLYLFTLTPNECGNAGTLHGCLHTIDGLAILELEDAGDEGATTSVEPDYYRLIRKSMNRFQAVSDLKELAQAVTEEIQRESSLDRVMIYYFHADDSGEVIAETKRADLGSWLNWRYPAHDIPRPAREIFRKIWSRPVPDVRAPLAEMVPLLNPVTNAPLDMTYCSLRGASVMYTEYLQNMGVGAAFTLPLIMEGNLWGLIACHHYTPRLISYRVRAACEFLAKAASQQLKLAEEREQSAYRARIDANNYALISKMASNLEISAFTDGTPNLLSAMEATGAAILYEGKWHMVGSVPTEPQLRELGKWLATQPVLAAESRPAFVTDTLSAQYRPALEFAQQGSGLLAFCYSTEPLGLVIWFRPETLQTFTWAGNPYELPLTSGPHGTRLTPRKSFEVWRETVSQRSLPWKNVEIESVLKLRGLIIDLVVSQAERLKGLRSALQLSRARFDISLDAAQLGAWELDPDDLTLWRTLRHDVIFGYDSLLPEWKFTRFVGHLHPEEREVITTEIKSAIAMGRTFDLETRIVDARGNEKWIWIYGTPIEASAGSAYVGLVGDITNRKTADQRAKTQSSLSILRSSVALALASGKDENETLRAWARLLAEHVATSHVLIWTADEQGVLQVRATAGEQKSIRPSDFDLPSMGRDGAFVVADLPDRPGAIAAPLRQNGIVSVATFPIHAGASTLGVVIVCTRSLLSDGIFEEIKTMIEGVNLWLKRRRAERTAADASERVRLAVDAVSMGTWDYYPVSGVLEWSPRCKALFGFPPEAHVDYQTFLSAVHPDDRDRVGKGVDAALNPQGGGHSDMEFRTVGLKDGVMRWVRSTGQTYLDSKGEVLRFIGTVQDISEMIKARELLASRGRQLQALVDARTAELTSTIGELEAFSYSISHDMRSPLRAMQGFSRALLEEYGEKLDDEGRDYLQRIDRGSKRLDMLIQDILSYSTMAKGESVTHPLLLEPLLQEIIHNNPELQPPRAQVVLELVPQPVMGHEAFLSQVFSNLLGNAVKFQSPGSEPVITVKSELFGPWTRVWISDNGIGIEPEHHKRIFQIFGRVHSEKRFEGTGIGLAIVKKAVDRLGGEIGLESEAGRGTRFWFTVKSATP